MDVVIVDAPLSQVLRDNDVDDDDRDEEELDLIWLLNLLNIASYLYLKTIL